MAGLKGKIPIHVKKAHFVHPGCEYPLINALEKIEDPRKPSLFFRHSLTSILFMVLVAMVWGATDWHKVVVMCEGMKEWIAQYVDIRNGIPCERTFKDVFNLIDPEKMEGLLLELSSLIRKNYPQKVINFDGQTERGTADKDADIKGIHLMNVWSSDNEICLGQLKVNDKSNEITAMPKLMESLELKGTIITADALNTQKATVEKAIEKGADYVFPIKGNHPNPLEETISAFKRLDEEEHVAINQWEHNVEKARQSRDKTRLKKLLSEGVPSSGASHWEEGVSKEHGRIEQRSCTAISVKGLPFKDEWEGVMSIARVCRERTKRDKTEHNTTYYMTSLEPNSELIGQVVRKHWGVESMHWRLDVTFKQDNSRYRNRIGARNLAIVRKLILNGLLKEKSLKGGIATKQCAAACNPVYREKVLKNLF